jgi:hypothetical protein
MLGVDKRVDSGSRFGKEIKIFSPNRKFKRKYRQIFKKDPLAANIFLLLCELAGPEGKVNLPNEPGAAEKELQALLVARFEDPRGWNLGGNVNG